MGETKKRTLHEDSSSPSSSKVDPYKKPHFSSANKPSLSVEKVLDDTGIRLSQQDVEEVLKLSYGFPGPAVKFFRWSGHQLNDKHSPYAWNLIVEMLGKNRLFDAMRNAIKSMKDEGLLSLATFAFVFSSYC
ncbi:unnamed protein product [Ilex paraguariensis]|uniref:Pentatricopeptide repeat-containing protein n=1 Tax=Ilex paraguariensis TaxID=185542 RepID=A0ABC8S871_9AQUA